MSDFGEYGVHPAAELFPLLEGQELADLAADIKANGLRNPIIVHDNMIVDGRNRYRACCLAGVPVFTDYYRGPESVLQWVVSQNLHRRHMDASQRAMVAAKIIKMFEADAKEHPQRGRKTPPANLPDAGVAREKDTAAPHAAANLPDSGDTLSKIAAAMNVSPRSVQDAKTVMRRGSPREIEAVEKREVAVYAAARAIRNASKTPVSPRGEPRPVNTGGKWSVPRAIPEMAAFIRRHRTPDEVRELVHLLSEIADGADHPTLDSRNATALGARR